MRFLAVLCFLFLTCSAFAQQAPSRTFKFELSDADVAVVDKGLGGLPYREAAPVIARMQQQLNEQLKPPVPEPKPEK